MPRYKAKETHYGQGGQQYTKGQEIDEAAFNALPAGERWWFTPVDSPPAATQRPAWIPPPAAPAAAKPPVTAPPAMPPPSSLDRTEIAGSVAERAIGALAHAHSTLQEARATMADAHVTFLETVEEKFKVLEEKFMAEFSLIKEKLHHFFHPGETVVKTQSEGPAPVSSEESVAKPVDVVKTPVLEAKSPADLPAVAEVADAKAAAALPTVETQGHIET